MSQSGINTKTEFKKVTHCIFDNDGVILETENIYKNVFAGIASKYGKLYTPDVQMKVMGRPAIEAVATVINELNLPTTQNELLKEFRTESKKVIGSCPIIPGAERLIRHFHKHNIPIAVATSSHEETFQIKISNHQEIFSLFNHIVTGGSDPEVVQGKPAPDIFLVCAKRFPDNPLPEYCLVFEDTPNGVKAALAAGMQVVVVPDPNTDPELCKDATLKVNSLEDVKLELFGLPPFQ